MTNNTAITSLMSLESRPIWQIKQFIKKGLSTVKAFFRIIKNGNRSFILLSMKNMVRHAEISL